MISVSILGIKEKREDKINIIDNLDIDYIHLDVTDGLFTSSFTALNSIIDLLPGLKKPLDVHLMVENPKEYIDALIPYKPDFITIHREIDGYKKHLEYIKTNNIKCGICIKPDTPIEEVFDLIGFVDLFLILSVNPGFSGQKFIDVTKKISSLKSLIVKQKNDALIEVDGGINDTNYMLCLESGADIIVVGSYVTNGNDYAKQVESLTY